MVSAHELLRVWHYGNYKTTEGDKSQSLRSEDFWHSSAHVARQSKHAFVNNASGCNPIRPEHHIRRKHANQSNQVSKYSARSIGSIAFVLQLTSVFSKRAPYLSRANIRRVHKAE